jgi:hypothetical protein
MCISNYRRLWFIVSSAPARKRCDTGSFCITSDGASSPLAVIASILLTIGHSGIAFQGGWDSRIFPISPISVITV